MEIFGIDFERNKVKCIYISLLVVVIVLLRNFQFISFLKTSSAAKADSSDGNGDEEEEIK